MRFTHANRHCPDHPYDALKRCEDDLLMNSQPEEQSTEILKWLQKYREDRQHLLQQQSMSPSPNNSRKTPKRSASSSTKANDENKKRAFSRTIATTPSGIYAQENQETPTSEMLAMSPSKAARKGLMCEMDMNAGAATSLQSSTPIQVIPETADLAAIMGSPISANKPKHCRPKVILWKEPIDDVDDDLLDSGSSELRVSHTPELVQEAKPSYSPAKKSFNPKKKWLREAWQEDLGARPLDGYGTNHPLYKEPSQTDTNNWQMASSSNTSASSSSDSLANPNQNRPSVLIMGPNLHKDKEF